MTNPTPEEVKEETPVVDPNARVHANSPTKRKFGDISDTDRIMVENAFAMLIAGDPNNRTVQPEPFYGRILSSFVRHYCKNEDAGHPFFVPTAAVFLSQNKVNLIVNVDFFRTLTAAGRVAILKHECQHITHRHLWRARKHEVAKDEPELTNISMDAVINQYNPAIVGIQNVNGEPIGEINYKDYPPIAKLPGETWERYFDLLHEEKKKQQNQQQGQQGQPQQGQGQPGGQNQGQGQGQAQGGDGTDDHSLWNYDDGLTNPEAVKDDVEEKIRREAHSVYAGRNPQEIEEILEDINRQSKIPWQQLLKQWVKSSVNSLRDQHILRESYVIEGVFPGWKNEPRPEYHVYVDVSGSVSDDLAELFFSEINAIIKRMKATVWVHQFDTQIHHSELIEKRIGKVVRHAAGGTNFQCVMDHARKNHIKHVLLLTDGYAPEVDTTGLNVLVVYTPQHADNPCFPKHVVVED